MAHRPRIPALFQITVDYVARNVPYFHNDKLWPVLLANPEVHSALDASARKFNVYSQDTINSFFTLLSGAQQTASTTQAKPNKAQKPPNAGKVPQYIICCVYFLIIALQKAPAKKSSSNPFALLSEDFDQSDEETIDSTKPLPVSPVIVEELQAMAKSLQPLPSPVSPISHITRISFHSFAHIPVVYLNSFVNPPTSNLHSNPTHIPQDFDYLFTSTQSPRLVLLFACWYSNSKVILICR